MEAGHLRLGYQHGWVEARAFFLTYKISTFLLQPHMAFPQCITEIFLPLWDSLEHTNAVQKQCVYQVMISQRIISFALINYS